MVALEGEGDGTEENRPAWRRSNLVQAASLLGFLGLVIALDWVLNERLTYLGSVAIGIAVGLAALAVRHARRRRAGRP